MKKIFFFSHDFLVVIAQKYLSPSPFFWKVMYMFVVHMGVPQQQQQSTSKKQKKQEQIFSYHN
jgi:hypothetical protein